MKLNFVKLFMELDKSSSDDNDVFDESDGDYVVSKSDESTSHCIISRVLLCRPYDEIKIITNNLNT